MKSNELRVGNLIYFKSKVISVLPSNISLLYHIELAEAENKDLRPIPITPDILEKAGFIVDDFGYHKKTLPDGNVLGIWIEDAIWIYNDLSTAYNEITLTRPVSLHQLQNLYFYLTGVELKVEIATV